MKNHPFQEWFVILRLRIVHKIDNSSFSHFRYIVGATKMLMGHMTWPHPFLGGFSFMG